MNIVTHAAVGLAISGAFPEEYRLAAVAFSVLPDVDHLLRWRTMRPKLGGLNDARTVAHELLGSVGWVALAGLLALYDPTLAVVAISAVTAHLFCDFVNGWTMPFRAIRDLPAVQMGSLPIKLLQESLLTGGALWLFWQM